ncbi:SIMPL domain-containing protein [Thermaerobacter litoralis]
MSPDAESRQPTLFATGYGRVSVTPDVAVLRFYVYRTHPTNHMVAYREAVAAAQQVIAALRDEGLADDDLRTVDIETNTHYHTDRQGRRHLIEHEVRYVLEARARDFELAGKLIGRALAVGASEATLWGLEVSDVRDLELQAVAEAVRHARERAEAAARAAGVRLGPPLRMNLRLSGHGGRYGYRDSYAVYAAGPADEASAPITPGKRDIGAEVEVTFALEPNR